MFCSHWLYLVEADQSLQTLVQGGRGEVLPSSFEMLIVSSHFNLDGFGLDLFDIVAGHEAVFACHGPDIPPVLVALGQKKHHFALFHVHPVVVVSVESLDLRHRPRLDGLLGLSLGFRRLLGKQLLEGRVKLLKLLLVEALDLFSRVRYSH